MFTFSLRLLLLVAMWALAPAAFAQQPPADPDSAAADTSGPTRANPWANPSTPRMADMPRARQDLDLRPEDRVALRRDTLQWQGADGQTRPIELTVYASEAADADTRPLTILVADPTLRARPSNEDTRAVADGIAALLGHDLLILNFLFRFPPPADSSQARESYHKAHFARTTRTVRQTVRRRVRRRWVRRTVTRTVPGPIGGPTWSVLNATQLFAYTSGAVRLEPQPPSPQGP